MKRKLAEIRKNDNQPCPFGLPVPFGCQYAGQHTDRMAPVSIMGKDTSDKEKVMIGNANTKLLAWNLLRSSEQPTQCPYAGHILPDKDAVECNYEDAAPGQGPSQALMAAPFYSKIFSGVINGLFTYPTGFYSDYNISRNLYFGVNSLVGADRHELLRLAAEEVVARTVLG